MRVLHITPSVRLLGARRSLLTLVKELSGTPVESLVVVPSRGGLTEEFDRLRIAYDVLFLPPWRKASSWTNMFQQVTKLRRLIEDFKPDLIHCNEIYPTPHALVAASQGHVTSELLSRITTRHSIGPLNIPVITHMRLSVTERLIQNYFLADATRIIAVSHGAASDFDNQYWKADRVRVVYNGIDFQPFDAAASRRKEIRSSLGLNDEHFLIGQLGLMMPRKRPRYLIDAADEIIKRVPAARFLLMGDASPGQEQYLADLKQAAASSPRSEHFLFMPFQQQVAAYFAALDLNVLVSSDEGFGRVVPEAGCLGIPSVGSRTGGIPELIDDGKSGFLLGEPEASDEAFWKTIPELAAIVEKLASDNTYYGTISTAAQEKARTQFNVDRCIDATLHVFNEAINAAAGCHDRW